MFVCYKKPFARLSSAPLSLLNLPNSCLPGYLQQTATTKVDYLHKHSALSTDNQLYEITSTCYNANLTGGQNILLVYISPPLRSFSTAAANTLTGLGLRKQKYRTTGITTHTNGGKNTIHEVIPNNRLNEVSPIKTNLYPLDIGLIAILP